MKMNEKDLIKARQATKFITALASLILTIFSIIINEISKYISTATNIYNIETAYFILLCALLSLAISYGIRLKGKNNMVS